MRLLHHGGKIGSGRGIRTPMTRVTTEQLTVELIPEWSRWRALPSPPPSYELGALLNELHRLEAWSTVRGSSPVMTALQAAAFPFRQRCMVAGP